MAPDPDPTAPVGLRAQIANVVAAARRLVTAHVELAKAEAGEILGEVGRAAAYGGIAAAFLLLAGLVISIGGLLFLGDWLFGSIGWGAVLGSLLLVDAAVVLLLAALRGNGERQGRAFAIAAILGIVVGVVLGLDLTNRGWSSAADAVLQTVDVATRPLLMALATLGIIGAILGLVAGARSGSAVGGLIGGALAGLVLGAITATAVGPRVGAAFGVLTWLVAWPVLAGIDVARTGIDTDALKARFWPETTIEMTKETIEWVRQRTPLGPRS